MSTVSKSLLTAQEYLRKERAAQHKSEFYRGEMFAMAGASRRHVRICLNLTGLLDEQLRGSACEVFNSDMKVKVTPSGLYTYPDTSIACGGSRFEDDEEDVLLNPCAIFEVLSASTERRDRGWKFDRYCELRSMADYVLVSQDKPLVEHFVRQPDDHWHLERIKDLETPLRLTSAPCSLRLSAIYLNVQFGQDEEDLPPAEQPEVL